MLVLTASTADAYVRRTIGGAPACWHIEVRCAACSVSACALPPDEAGRPKTIPRTAEHAIGRVSNFEWEEASALW